MKKRQDELQEEQQEEYKVFILERKPTDWRKYNENFVLIAHRPLSEILESMPTKKTVPPSLFYVNGDVRTIYTGMKVGRFFPEGDNVMEFGAIILPNLVARMESDKDYILLNDADFFNNISHYTGVHPLYHDRFPRYLSYDAFLYKYISLSTKSPSSVNRTASPLYNNSVDTCRYTGLHLSPT